MSSADTAWHQLRHGARKALRRHAHSLQQWAVGQTGRRRPRRDRLYFTKLLRSEKGRSSVSVRNARGKSYCFSAVLHAAIDARSKAHHHKACRYWRLLPSHSVCGTCDGCFFRPRNVGGSGHFDGNWATHGCGLLVDRRLHAPASPVRGLLCGGLRRNLASRPDRAVGMTLASLVKRGTSAP